MKVINFENKKEISVHFDRIRPFSNVCAVTGVKELCNIVVDYTPSDKVIDIVDFRKYFEGGFNELIEDIAIKVFEEIVKSANPKKLRVQVFLEGNEHLTERNVVVEK